MYCMGRRENGVMFCVVFEGMKAGTGERIQANSVPSRVQSSSVARKSSCEKRGIRALGDPRLFFAPSVLLHFADV